jgi:hypothetical protein
VRVRLHRCYEQRCDASLGQRARDLEVYASLDRPASRRQAAPRDRGGAPDEIDQLALPGGGSGTCDAPLAKQGGPLTKRADSRTCPRACTCRTMSNGIRDAAAVRETGRTALIWQGPAASTPSRAAQFGLELDLSDIAMFYLNARVGFAGQGLRRMDSDRLQRVTGITAEVTPEWAAGICGVDADDIRRAAEIFDTSDRVVSTCTPARQRAPNASTATRCSPPTPPPRSPNPTPAGLASSKATSCGSPRGGTASRPGPDRLPARGP